MAVNFRYGDIVLVNYPFGPHPAYVIYDSGDSDVVVCMITSHKRSEQEEIEIPQGEGNIKHTSYIRTHKIATISKKLVGSAIIGKVSRPFAREVALKLTSWLPTS
jgi:mRNA-degrading endonuclease toxin of MazEF toxin-antitoxin module